MNEIVMDDPKLNSEVVLAWEINVKNCLPMNHGFSSVQLGHAGGKVFAEMHCDKSLKSALRHHVRAGEKEFKSGNRVYDKQDGQDRWKGPAVVIGDDGSVYCICHQGTRIIIRR